MSGRDLNKLRKEPEVSGDIEYESAHVNLESVRRNYDSVHKEKNYRENSISKLKVQSFSYAGVKEEALHRGGRTQR